MSGILDRRSRRFVGSESNERVLTARVARDDINRGEKIQGKMQEKMQEKVDKDDFLITQIDEFREKAKRLQEMLKTKETKAKELSSIVEEREAKADELQQILDERQAKADGITAQVVHICIN